MDEQRQGARTAPTATASDAPVRRFTCGRCGRPVQLAYAALPCVPEDAAAAGWTHRDVAHELHLRYGCV